MVRTLDHFWHSKYTEDAQGEAVRVPAVTGADEDHDDERRRGDPHADTVVLAGAGRRRACVILGYGLIYSTGVGSPWRAV